MLVIFVDHNPTGVKFPGVMAVLCVVPSGLVLHIGITSCTFPPWTEMSKKNSYDNYDNSTYCIFFKLELWSSAEFSWLR